LIFFAGIIQKAVFANTKVILLRVVTWDKKNAHISHTRTLTIAPANAVHQYLPQKWKALDGETLFLSIIV